MGLLYPLPKPLLCRNSEFPKFSTLNSLTNFFSLKRLTKPHLKPSVYINLYSVKHNKQQFTVNLYIHTHTHKAPSVTCQSVMLNSMVIASRTIIELAATQDRPIRKIQPKILREVTLLTFPATWRNFLSIIQLKEVFSMSVNKFIQYFSKTQCSQFLSDKPL